MIARYTPAVKRKAKDRDKPLVQVTYIPGRLAYLISEGPQQSEIRWVHNGNTHFICNEFIEKVKPP